MPLEETQRIRGGGVGGQAGSDVGALQRKKHRYRPKRKCTTRSDPRHGARQVEEQVGGQHRQGDAGADSGGESDAGRRQGVDRRDEGQQAVWLRGHEFPKW